MRAAILAAVVAAAAGARAQEPADAAVLALVERFFAAQQSEDAAAYLSLWSAKAQKPQPQQLAHIFSAGDDRFSELAIVSTAVVGDLVRVRASVKRERTDAKMVGPDGRPRVFSSRPIWSLTLVREGGELKIFSEGMPADDLAVALIATPSLEGRERLLASEPELLNELLLSALNRRAGILAQAQAFGEAVPIYERVIEAARRMGNRKAEGEAFQNIGNARYFQRDFPAARTAYEERLAIERATGNDLGAAHALLGIATVQYSQFEYADALVSYRGALAAYAQVGDDAGMASALVSTGNVLYLQGDYEAAIADYTRSRDLHRKVLNTDGEARALGGLGRVYTAQGDYAAALEAFAGVREEGRARGSRPMLGGAAQSIGDVHFRLGNLEAARAAFDEARQHFEAARDVAGAARVWQALALTDLAASRFAAAEQGYVRSHAACTSVRDAACAAAATVGLAFAQQSQEHYAEAIASYQKGIAAFTALNRVEEAARAEVGLSQAQFGSRAFAAALATAGRARERTEVPDIRWRAHVAEARAMRRMAQPDKAIASARRAVEIVKGMADESLARPSRRVPGDTVSAHAVLALLEVEAGDARGAFNTIEARSAHALRLALSIHEREIRRGMTDEEREAERQAANAVGAADAQLEKERDLPKPNQDRIARLEVRLADAIAARGAGRQRLFDRRPELRIWRGLAPAVTADEVLPLLDADGAAIVLFVIDEDDVLAVTAVRRGDAVTFGGHVSPISRQALAVLVAEAVRPAVLRDAALWREAAIGLLAAIPPAVVDILAAAPHTLVAPDDVLWRVPFEALPVRDSYVGKASEITYTGSVTAILRAPARASATPASPPVALAAPVLSAPLLARIKSTAPDWTIRAPESGLRELKDVAGVHGDPPAVTISGESATERAFRTAAPAASLVHVALPFRVNSASPLFSSMLSSSSPAPAVPPDETDDGTIEAREVMNMDLAAGVVLLTDGAALAMRDAAAAAGTLHWAWRAAGVPTLIIPRWPSDEPAGAALLADLHERLRAGETPAAALRQSRALARGREGASAPWFWAPWIILGR